MNVFVSKLALSKGILEIEVNGINGDGTIHVKDYQSLKLPPVFRRNDYHFTKDLAKKAAEKMRSDKIYFLQNEIDRLSKLDF